jgi:hypothetical protein
MVHRLCQDGTTYVKMDTRWCRLGIPGAILECQDGTTWRPSIHEDTTWRPSMHKRRVSEWWKGAGDGRGPKCLNLVFHHGRWISDECPLGFALTRIGMGKQGEKEIESDPCGLVPDRNLSRPGQSRNCHSVGYETVILWVEETAGIPGLVG